MGSKKFGNEIKRLRLKNQMKLREFCRQVKISPTYVSRIERGLDPPPADEKILRMAEVLGADKDMLFQLAERINPIYQNTLKLNANLPALVAEISGSVNPEKLTEKLIDFARKESKKE